MSIKKESMTSIERLQAAINLEKPDRVPVVPMVGPEAAACLTGLTNAQVSNDAKIAQSAFLNAFDNYGGWDSAYGGPVTPVQMQVANIYPMKMRIPGQDLPDDYMFQLVEEEIMKPEDYDKMWEMGPSSFYYEDYLWRINNFEREDLQNLLEEMLANMGPFRADCDQRAIELFVTANEFHPFFKLSVMRSLVPFTKDLYYNPEPVERALKQMTEELIPRVIGICKALGVSRWLFVDERASGFYYPLSIFERFWWPYTQEIIDAIWSEGITTIFHLDTCWDKNLHYFKNLPKGSTVLELDSTTDIFLAKEVLRGHLCIHGDVSASLLTVGKPEDVEAYCKKLIDEVGSDGGFIMGSGCAVPPNVKPENFRAMIDTSKNYELSVV